MPALNVSQATYDALRSYVFAKHGKLRGALQDEADAAIRAHVKRPANHVAIKEPNP